MVPTKSASSLGGVLGALYASEACALLFAISLYRNGSRSFLGLVTGRYTALFVVGLLGGLLSCGCLAIVARRTMDRRVLWHTVAMNVATVCVLLAGAELGVRLLSVRTPLGVEFLGVPLLPRSWDKVVARNRALLKTASANTSFFVADDRLGWTVGRSRRSADGLYASSAEGIRSDRPGVVYAARSVSYRIALVGDSFTFGLQVPFEESWGSRLEDSLGSDVQILNFGVDGYGVDQSYLRYARDVRQWHPSLVVMGFINHDLYRTLAVYPFVSFPQWGLPFAKPRLLVHGHHLEVINTPLPPPDGLLTRSSVADLPFIEYDRGYHPDEWQPRWFHRSYLGRFLTSRFPWGREDLPDQSEHAIVSINSEVITAFAKMADAEGSLPLVLYLPTRSDLGGERRDSKEELLGILRARAIRFEDLTSCLGTEQNAAALFLQGSSHYSAQGNTKVARCMRSIIIRLLRIRLLRPGVIANPIVPS